MHGVRKGRQWSTRASVPSFDSDSLQQLAFPDDSGANDGAPAKEDTSHVARRRLASEPAHELDVDEVELIDDALTAPVHLLRTRRDSNVSASGDVSATVASARSVDDSIDVEMPADASLVEARLESTPRETSPEPTSLAPLAMDYSTAKAPFDLPLAPPGELRPRRSYGALIACALVAVTVAGGFVVRRGALDPASLGAQPSVEQIVAPIAPVVPAAPAAPVKEAAPQAEAAKSIAPIEAPAATPLPPPPSTIGTIVGAADHRLWVDGALVTGFEASVRCGKHTVQVGSAGTPRAVDVPCGDSIKVAP